MAIRSMTASEAAGAGPDGVMKTFSWLDRLLIKIALAKAVARGAGDISTPACSLLKNFQRINAASVDASRSGADEGQQ